MDFILEIIFDLALENSVEIANNKKMNKYIRYPLVFLLSLVIIAVIGALLIAGIMFVLDKEGTTKMFGVLFIILDIFLIVSVIKKIRTKLNKKINQKK